MSSDKVAAKGNAFLKAVIESDDYNITHANQIMELIKVHVSEQLANDMLYQLLVDSFDEEGTHKIRIMDCGTKFICCIKLVRQFTGFGLKEAKDVCDKVRCGNPQTINIGRHRPDGTAVDIQEARKLFRDDGVVIA